jgi:opacity protein-like surface antigen
VPRSARCLLLAAVLLPGAAWAAQPAAEPWRPPPRFAAIWLQGGLFLPGDLPGSHAQEQVGLGMAIRPLSFASVFVEGGWVNRDYRGDSLQRDALVSRGLLVGGKLHHRVGPLEPSLSAAAALWRTAWEPGLPPFLFRRAAMANTVGLVLGAGLDWLPSEVFAVGAEWRWYRGRARFDTGYRPDLGGHAFGLAVRLYWP